MKALILIISVILCSSSMHAQKDSKKRKKSETVESPEKTKADERAKEEEEIMYTKVIAKADELFAARDFVKAKEMYSRAALLKPSDPYTKTKIEEIDQILATQQQEELDNHYSDVIKSADSCFTEKKYAEAKEKYTLALALKAAEQYPKTRIAEIQQLLNYEAPQLKEQEYAKLIAEADALFKSNRFVEAKEYYSKALLIKQDPYPKEKIAEIEAILQSKKSED